jgi:hypothetical protein
LKKACTNCEVTKRFPRFWNGWHIPAVPEWKRVVKRIAGDMLGYAFSLHLSITPRCFMKEDLYYFGIYADPEDIYERNPIPAPGSTNKMKYIISKINSRFNVRVVSPGFAGESGVHRTKRVRKDNYEIIYLSIKSSGYDYIKLCDVISSLSYLRKFIKHELKDNSKIIIYSNPWQTLTILNSLKKRNDIPKDNIIIEIEEFHGQAREINLIKKSLYNYFEFKSFKNVYRYIFVNEYIKNKVIVLNPKAQGPICYGEYRMRYRQRQTLSNDSIGLFYSGSIDYERGIMNFLEALSVYSDKYTSRNLKIVLDICGYFHGKKGGETKKSFFKAIDALTIKGIKVVFHGFLSEEELEKKLKESDICIAPQLIASSFGKYSFPSKVLQYLTYGKIVFASNIEAINNSSIKDHLFLYDSDFPTVIADRLHELLANFHYIQKENSGELNKYLNEKDRDFEIELLELLN